MRESWRFPFSVCLGALLLSGAWQTSLAGTIRVATYNLENYLDQAIGTRPAKTEEAKETIAKSICLLKPDVIALEEMGSTNALRDLTGRLSAAGLDFGFRELVQGFDTNIHFAVLSRLPILRCRLYTNENFLLAGRRFQVSRGFAEVDIQGASNFEFTLFAAHLKSRRPVPLADEADLRLEEARLLREKIDRRFKQDPGARVVVVGDFNDTKDTPVLKTIIGKGKFKLVDTRPAERNGDSAPDLAPGQEPRTVTWTYFYAKEDTYGRIDYILLSPAMARYWVTNQTYVLSVSDWGVGSDHRPIVASFELDTPVR
jgi:endonuclease/exonuclease/phosphatase family metal-dependent hydrolase